MADFLQDLSRRYRNFLIDKKTHQPNIPGLLEPGNIDLTNRPIVKNADGSTSTVYSMSFNDNGREVLIPRVHDDGYVMSPQQAVTNYYKTRKHLGIFSDPSAATVFAKQLHNNYASGRIKTTPTINIDLSSFLR